MNSDGPSAHLTTTSLSFPALSLSRLGYKEEFSNQALREKSGKTWPPALFYPLSVFLLYQGLPDSHFSILKILFTLYPLEPGIPSGP